MPETVWVVSRVDYSDFDVVGVFVREDDARAFASHQQQNRGDAYWVQERALIGAENGERVVPEARVA